MSDAWAWCAWIAINLTLIIAWGLSARYDALWERKWLVLAGLTCINVVTSVLIDQLSSSDVGNPWEGLAYWSAVAAGVGFMSNARREH